MRDKNGKTIRGGDLVWLERGDIDSPVVGKVTALIPHFAGTVCKLQVKKGGYVRGIDELCSQVQNSQQAKQ